MQDRNRRTETVDTQTESRNRHMVDYLVRDHSQYFIDFLSIDVEPYESHEWRTKCFYCFKPQEAYIALREYAAYLFAGYIYKTRNNSQAEAAAMVKQYFGDVFPSLSRVTVQRWYNKGEPTGSLPSGMTLLKMPEKSFPEAFNVENANRFFENGFGTLMASCFMNRNSKSSVIGGNARQWKYRMTPHIRDLHTKYEKERARQLRIAKKYDNYWEVINVIVARHLECIQNPLLMSEALRMLPSRTVTEFLKKMFGIIRNRNSSPNVHRVALSACKGTSHEIFHRWIREELIERKLDHLFQYEDMSEEVRFDFGRGEHLSTIIQMLDDELNIERDFAFEFDSAKNLIRVSQIEQKLDKLQVYYPR